MRHIVRGLKIASIALLAMTLVPMGLARAKFSNKGEVYEKYSTPKVIRFGQFAGRRSIEVMLDESGIFFEQNAWPVTSRDSDSRWEVSLRRRGLRSICLSRNEILIHRTSLRGWGFNVDLGAWTSDRGEQTRTYIQTRVPSWALLIMAGAIPAWSLLGFVRRRRRHPEGRCRNCGYDLRATPRRCPECGAIASERAAQVQ